MSKQQVSGWHEEQWGFSKHQTFRSLDRDRMAALLCKGHILH
jgi:hypothetical protein